MSYESFIPIEVLAEDVRTELQDGEITGSPKALARLEALLTRILGPWEVK